MDAGTQALLGLLVVPVAVLVDGFTGNILFRLKLSPVLWFRSSAAALLRKLDREKRGQRTLVVRGLLLAMVFPVLGALLGFALERVADDTAYGPLVAALGLAGAIGFRHTVDQARHLEATSAGLEAASVSAVNTIALAFAADFLGSVTWFLLAGLPGCYVWLGIRAAAGENPYAGGHVLVASRGVFALFLLLPAIIAGALLALVSGLVPATDPGAAWSAFLRPRGNIEDKPIRLAPAVLMAAHGGGGQSDKLRRALITVVLSWLLVLAAFLVVAGAAGGLIPR